MPHYIYVYIRELNKIICFHLQQQICNFDKKKSHLIVLLNSNEVTIQI